MYRGYSTDTEYQVYGHNYLDNIAADTLEEFFYQEILPVPA